MDNASTEMLLEELRKIRYALVAIALTQATEANKSRVPRLLELAQQ